MKGLVFMAFDTDIIIKVGQIWKCRKREYTITKIEGTNAYYGDCIEYFGELNEDGTSCDWDDDFECINVDVKVDKATSNIDELAFFGATASGNCKCNILKTECDYHNGC